MSLENLGIALIDLHCNKFSAHFFVRSTSSSSRSDDAACVIMTRVAISSGRAPFPRIRGRDEKCARALLTEPYYGPILNIKYIKYILYRLIGVCQCCCKNNRGLLSSFMWQHTRENSWHSPSSLQTPFRSYSHTYSCDKHYTYSQRGPKAHSLSTIKQLMHLLKAD